VTARATTHLSSRADSVTTRQIRIAALNLCAYPNRGWRAGLGELLAEASPDIVLLQEVRRSWVDRLVAATGLHFVHAHDVTPANARPPDGVAVSVAM